MKLCRCRQLKKSIKLCEYSRSRSFHDDLILLDQVSGERSQDQWSSGLYFSNFCSKNRLWVHDSNEYPQSMFWSKKKRKIGIPLHTLVLLYKSGVQGGIHYMDMFS